MYHTEDVQYCIAAIAPCRLRAIASTRKKT